jgi:hypothetical protein
MELARKSWAAAAEKVLSLLFAFLRLHALALHSLERVMDFAFICCDSKDASFMRAIYELRECIGLDFG